MLRAQINNCKEHKTSNANQVTNINPITSQPDSAASLIVYPYPQQPATVSNAVASHIDTLKNAGFDPGKIFDICRDSQLIKQHEQRDTNNNPTKNQDKGQNKGQDKNPVKNPIKNPLQYLRKIRGLSDEARKIRYSEVENVFNNAISSWKSISPLSFLKQYHTYIHHSKNDSGLECGMIHHRIINAADPAERIIIIDASTEYLEFCCSDDNTRSKELFFYFSDDRIKDVLKFEPRIPKNFRINTITQLSVTSRSTRILLFGNPSKRLLESAFNKIHELYAQKSNYIVYAVLPSTYIENSDFSKYVVSKFRLLEVAIIDSAAVNISPTKRCIVSLSTKYGYNREKQVPFQLIKKEVSSDSANISLQCSQPVNVDLSDILAGQQTLNKLYASAINKHAEQRKQPNVHMFSPEILIYYSFVTLPNGHLRAKYSFYRPPTPSQLRRNTIPRGKGLCTGISGKVVSDLDGITNYADELLFTHNTLPEIVRKTIKDHYRHKPIHLKTAWYTYLPEIDTKDDKSRYDEEICRAILLGTDNRIASLEIHSEASADDISAEISQYCRDNSWSNTKTNDDI